MAKNVVVIGTQWGDEGKGKVVDWLTDHAQGVVRFQGGHNAGHTLVIGDEITVTVMGVKGNQIRLGINAPKSVAVHREETSATPSIQ